MKLTFRFAGRLAALLVAPMLVVACATDRADRPATTTQTPPATTATQTQVQPSQGMVIDLRTGATLQLPMDATLDNAGQPVPENLYSSRIYRAPSTLPNSVIIVTEPRYEGQSCQPALEAEWAQMQRDFGNPDPDMLPIYQVQQVDMRRVGTAQALYGEMRSRSAIEASQDMPYRSMAAYLVCEDDTFVLVGIVPLGSEQLSSQDRQTLDNVVRSLRAP